MRPEISSSDVLAARAGLDELSLESANALFARTWLASHVRLVALATDLPTDPALLLAWALEAHPGAECAPQDWLPGTRLRSASDEELRGAIAAAEEDLEEDPDRHSPLLAHALSTLTPDEADWIIEIESDPQANHVATAYSHGPTRWLAWATGLRFWLLELHHES